MRAVAVDNVGAGVDGRMGEFLDVAARFAKGGLGAVGHVRVLRAFRAAVEADDDDVVAFLEL